MPGLAIARIEPSDMRGIGVVRPTELRILRAMQAAGWQLGSESLFTVLRQILNPSLGILEERLPQALSLPILSAALRILKHPSAGPRHIGGRMCPHGSSLMRLAAILSAQPGGG